MELIIKIPEEVYKTVQDGSYCGSLYEELKAAIPYNPSGDCISRSAFIQSLNDEFHGMISDETLHIHEIIKRLNNAPPVVPERQKGEWIKEPNGKTTDIYRCSVCKRSIMLCKGADLTNYPFCHCGADMRGEKEE